jgi:RimJ/RimL family protein N-acetyltransferase
MIELYTDRLRLRPATVEDLEAFHAILSDPRAMTYWSTTPHTDREQTRAWLDSMLRIESAEGEDFVIEHAGHVIGKAGLYRFPEVGFIVHPDHWGHGIATEALSAVLDRALSVHRLPSIEADVDPRNGASLRVLEKLGFVETARRVRTWFVGGQWCDSVYLRLDADDWFARRRT